MSSSELCVVLMSFSRMSEPEKTFEQPGDAVPLALRLIGVDQRVAAIGEREVVGRKLRRNGIELLLQLELELLLAELVHQRGLVLDQDHLALVDDADPVGHQLGLFDVMRGQDDGDAGGAERAHHLPHVLAQFDVDAGGRLVQEQNLRLVRQRLGDQHAPLHAAGQRHDLLILLVPERDVLQHLLDEGRIVRLAEQPAAEGAGRPHRLEGVGVKLLRHKPDHGARGAVVADVVVAVHRHGAAGRIGDAADDVDQRGLAGAVRPEQRENLAAPDLQVDAFQRLETRVVGLGKISNGDDGLHGDSRAGRVARI